MKSFIYLLVCYLGLLLIVLFVSGCATSLDVVKQDVKIFYQKDIKFKVESEINDKEKYSGEFFGSGVIPNLKRYKITVYPDGKADVLSVMSCHRELRTNEPDKEFFKKGYTFEIEPVVGLEVGRACPIEIGVYDKRKGRNGWAFLAIESDKYQLSSSVKCNGKKTNYAGVSTCQSRKGLIQEFKFDREVEFVSTPECKIADNLRGNNFIFQMPRGSCTVYFVDVKSPEIVHQANLYGYDEILLKE